MPPKPPAPRRAPNGFPGPPHPAQDRVRPGSARPAAATAPPGGADPTPSGPGLALRPGQTLPPIAGQGGRLTAAGAARMGLRLTGGAGLECMRCGARWGAHQARGTGWAVCPAGGCNGPALGLPPRPRRSTGRPTK